MRKDLLDRAGHAEQRRQHVFAAPTRAPRAQALVRRRRLLQRRLEALVLDGVEAAVRLRRGERAWGWGAQAGIG
jgi:hypothetical protein